MITPAPITAAQVAATATAYYTLDIKLKKGTIRQLTFTNTDTSAHTIAVNLVPAAGSASTTNQIGPTRSLAAGESYTWYEAINMTLLPGGAIYATCDAASKVNIQGTVMEYSY